MRMVACAGLSDTKTMATRVTVTKAMAGTTVSTVSII